MISEQKEVSSKTPHRNLIAWEKSMDLAVALSSQLRRAAISVPSNISEGAADRTTQQFSNFLSNAIGSLNEIDTQLDLVLRLGYLTENDYNRLHKMLDECLALTYGLRKSLGAQKSGS